MTPAATSSSDSVERGQSLPDGEFAQELGSDDPLIGLRAVVALRSLADRLEVLHVEQARRRDWSWQQIAAVLGISKQAVHKKYGRPRG